MPGPELTEPLSLGKSKVSGALSLPPNFRAMRTLLLPSPEALLRQTLLM